MRIAFDAKRAFSNSTGLGQYSRNLLEGLSRYFPQHQYFLFTGNQDSDRFLIPDPSMKPMRPKGIWAPFHSLWRSWGVSLSLKDLGMDLYHGLSHEIPLGMPRTGTPTVVTMHDLIFERFPQQYPWIDRRLYRAKGKYACKHSDLVLAISHRTAMDLEEIYGVNPGKIRVCYQSCSPRFLIQAKPSRIDDMRQHYGLPPAYFLYVGSLIERKNLENLLKAMAQIPSSRRMPLVVVGSGSKTYEARARKLVEASNLGSQVYFMKDRTASPESLARLGDDLPLLYQGAYALIYPSFYEGFGIPVLEAMASGTPVISSQSSCLPETGGDAPLYVDPANIESIKMAMETLIDHPEHRLNMMEKGRRQAEKFSLESCTRNLMSVYEELI